MQELIKDVKGWEEYYSVSNFGYVISKERLKSNGKVQFKKKASVLKPARGVSLHLREGNRSKSTTVLELVAKHFLELPTELPKQFYVVEQKDKSKGYESDNLEYQINPFSLRVFDMEGNWLDDYVDLPSFNNAFNLNITSAYRNAYGGAISTQGFQFRYLRVNNQVNNIKQIPSALNKMRSDTTPVIKYWGDKLICVYNSITEAAECNQLEVEQVWESYGRNKEIKGFLFKKI